MGLGHNPSLITDGLYGFWDMANTRSYSGSGATWNDLSGRNVTSTWSSSYTYNTGNYGYMNSTFGYASAPFANSSFTSLSYFMWSYITNTGSYTPFMINRGSGGNTTGLNAYNNILNYIWNDDIGTYQYNSGLTFSNNVWNYCAISVSPTSAIFCLNNSFNSRSYSHSSTTIGAGFQIFSDPTGGFYNAGRLACCGFYNRALTANEISLNFNALRGRFGI